MPNDLLVLEHKIEGEKYGPCLWGSHNRTYSRRQASVEIGEAALIKQCAMKRKVRKRTRDLSERVTTPDFGRIQS